MKQLGIITSSLFKPIGRLLDAAGRRMSEEHLIVFDRKSLWFIFFLVVLFVFLVIFKIQYSSIAIWDTIVTEREDAAPSRGTIFGTPKFIRMDEWRVFTPFVLSQTLKNFPVENYSLGPGKAPLLIGLPTHHFTSLFQPQDWGFFILDMERGYSYSWNYGMIGLILSSFLLLMLLTKSNFWLSVFGSLFLFFSSFIQWWGTWGTSICAGNAVVVAFIYLVLSKRPLTIILSAVIALLFLLNFTLQLYPPFQIPMGMLMAACCAGYLAQNFNWPLIKSRLKLRTIMLLACVSAAAIVLFFFFLDIKDTLALTLNTAYPGKRISLGGQFGIDRLFSGFFGIFFNEDKFPWMNVCETSSFLLFYPAIVTVILINAFRRKVEPLQIALAAYLVFLTLYVVVGFFPFLSKVTFLSMVPSRRAVIGLGLGSIFLTCVFLNSKKSALNINPFKNAVLFGLVLACFVTYGLYLKARTGNFFQPWQLGAISILFSVAVSLLVNQKKLLFCTLVLVYVVVSTFSVLPVSSGLGCFFNKKLYHVVRSLVAKDPEARWLVYGSPLHSGFIVAAGANVFNGTKYNPDIPTMRLLDPAGSKKNIYNRYANILVVSSHESETVDFRLLYEDCYGISISPFSEKLKKMRITYLLMPSTEHYYNLEEGEKRGIVPVIEKPIDNFWILKIAAPRSCVAKGPS